MKCNNEIMKKKIWNEMIMKMIMKNDEIMK